MNDAKRELVRAWLTKAARDLAAARLVASSLPDIAVYHCQQAAEKALKAYLAHYDFPIEKTHDVGFLIEQAMVVEPVFGSWLDIGERLTPYATAYRYPGIEDQPSPEDLEEALDGASVIYRQILLFLPAELHPRD